MNRGFGIKKCPICGSEDGVFIDLNNLMFRCPGECEFDLDDVKKLVEGWQKVIEWESTK